MQQQTRSTNRGTNNAYIDLEREHGSLAVGTTVSGAICPKCYGGRTNEGSLSVTRKRTSLVFCCHRDSCAFRGELGILGGGAVYGTEREPERKSERPSYYSVRKGPIPDYWLNYLLVKYGMGPHQIAQGRAHWTQQHSPGGCGRLLLPVLDEDGIPYGYTARKLDNQQGAKTLMYVENSKGSWHAGPPSKQPKLIIVEDQMSAIRASHYLNSMALLGTNLTDAALTVLKAKKYDTIYLALDADAFPTSIRLAHRLRKAGVKVTVLRLKKDIKNMNEVELVNWFDEQGINWYE